MMRNILLLSILAAGGIVCAKEKLILVENREPQAVIVTADMPAPVAEYAARNCRLSVSRTFRLENR